MLSQIAQVFSSQGVIVPGTELVPIPGSKGRKVDTGAADKSSDFRALFDQASTKLELSKRAQALQAGDSQAKDGSKKDDAKSADAAASKKPDGKPLSKDEEKRVEELAKRDREVKAHEQAHLANAGGYAKGGASFQYKAGPDGRNYAVGGSVQIDTSPVEGNPEATLQKALTVQRAALAPADPSSEDRSVAAAGAKMAQQAEKEIAQKQAQEAGSAQSGGPEKGVSASGDAAAGKSGEAADGGAGSGAAGSGKAENGGQENSAANFGTSKVSAYTRSGAGPARSGRYFSAYA